MVAELLAVVPLKVMSVTVAVAAAVAVVSAVEAAPVEAIMKIHLHLDSIHHCMDWQDIQQCTVQDREESWPSSALVWKVMTSLLFLRLFAYQYYLQHQHQFSNYINQTEQGLFYDFPL